LSAAAAARRTSSPFHRSRKPPPELAGSRSRDHQRIETMKTLGSDLPSASESESFRDSTNQTGIFALTGEYWTIGYCGVNCSLRNSLGLGYLQRLLQNPGEEFHVQDLLMGAGTWSAPDAERRDDAALRSERLIPRRPSDLGPMLDAQAKQEYKRRLSELTEELEDLRERGAYD
jgi:hypothetical protein